jgi:hypothetical protein
VKGVLGDGGLRPAGGGRAAELGLSVNVVYLARSRVLNRPRQDLDGLLD